MRDEIWIHVPTCRKSLWLPQRNCWHGRSLSSTSCFLVLGVRQWNRIHLHSARAVRVKHNVSAENDLQVSWDIRRGPWRDWNRHVTNGISIAIVIIIMFVQWQKYIGRKRSHLHLVLKENMFVSNILDWRFFAKILLSTKIICVTLPQIRENLNHLPCLHKAHFKQVPT